MVIDKLTSAEKENLKFKIAVEAIANKKAIPGLSKKYNVSLSQIYDWKKALEENGPKFFTDKRCTENKNHDEIKRLNETIERVTEERNFLAHAFNRLP